MNHCGDQQLSYAELDRMAAGAEVLPQRLALSAGPQPPVYYAAGPHTEVFYACQTTESAGTSGLLGLGLLAQPAQTSTTCVPGVVHAR